MRRRIRLTGGRREGGGDGISDRDEGGDLPVVGDDDDCDICVCRMGEADSMPF